MSPRAGTRLPSLDGWRAVSITLVLGAHCIGKAGFPKAWENGFTWLFDGNLGVRFFFVLSGFLISWLLLGESDARHAISFKDFYLRRAIRILPVYGMFLVALGLLGCFTVYHTTTTEWITNLTFTRNFIFGGPASRHLWSLSVEEQFYLLWPALFVLSGYGRRWWLTLLVLGGPMLIAPLARVIAYLHPHFAWPLFTTLSTLNYFDSLAYGCAGAICLSRAPEAVGRWVANSWMTALAVAAIALPYVLTHKERFGLFTVPLGPMLQGLAFTFLLIKSVLNPRGIFSVLNWAWVKWLGVLSYSIYIWQQLFYSDAKDLGWPESVWFLRFPGWLLAAVLTATLSYYLLEKPLLKLRARLRPKV